MAWTEEQRRSVVAEYWVNGEARCPDDDALLDLTKTPVDRDRDYLLKASCPACRAVERMSRADDPLKDGFRDWTTDERQELRAGYTQQRAAECPVCHSAVEFLDTGGRQGNLRMSCHRCGGFASEALG